MQIYLNFCEFVFLESYHSECLNLVIRILIPIWERFAPHFVRYFTGPIPPSYWPFCKSQKFSLVAKNRNKSQACRDPPRKCKVSYEMRCETFPLVRYPPFHLSVPKFHILVQWLVDFFEVRFHILQSRHSLLHRLLLHRGLFDMYLMDSSESIASNKKHGQFNQRCTHAPEAEVGYIGMFFPFSQCH